MPQRSLAVCAQDRQERHSANLVKITNIIIMASDDTSVPSGSISVNNISASTALFFVPARVAAKHLSIRTGMTEARTLMREASIKHRPAFRGISYLIAASAMGINTFKASMAFSCAAAFKSPIIVFNVSACLL